jgi:hypothetical protein
MASTIRTALLVTIIALLIWVWSEGESLKDLSVSPRVTFVEEAPDLVIETGPEWRGLVQVRLKGSTLAIDQAEDLLSAPLRLWPGQPGVPAEAGEGRVVDLAKAVREIPEIKDLGVTVTDVDPPTVVVRIIRRVLREIPVRAEIPPELELEGEATVVPARVALRLPEQAAGQLGETAFAIAAIDAAEVRRIKDDGPLTITAPVRLPAVLVGVNHILMSADKVNVTVRLKKRVAAAVLGSVPVRISLPPTEGARWNIEILDPFLADVTVTGPADLVERFRARQLIPIAQLHLSSDELEQGLGQKDAVFTGVIDEAGELQRMPPGIEFSAPSRTVRLAISSRDTGEPVRRNGPDAPEGSP